MAFGTVLLYLLLVYIRPGEVLPVLEGLPIALVTQVLSLVAVGLSLLLRPRNVVNQPHDRYVLGFFGATLVSNIAWGWFGGAVEAFVKNGPQVAAYFMLRGAVRTPRHLRWVGYAIVAATLFQAANGIAQFRSGVGLGGVAALDSRLDNVDQNLDGDLDPVRRIRGTGIFNDPNDLAMAFVVIVPLVVGPLLYRRSRLWLRAAAVAVLSPVLTALYYTNSRGGILGLGAALLPYCFKFGKIVGALVATVGVVGLLAFGPSRMSQMDSEESSAQGRVQAWSEGLQMFKSRPIFGVGHGRYTEFNELVAHNSFVHTLAELGIVGAFFFTGMIYWLFRGLPRVRAPLSAKPEWERFSAWGDDLRRGSLGMVVCAMFLSRQYSSVLLNAVAMGACYRALLQEADPRVGHERVLDVAAIGTLTVLLVATFYVVVQVLAFYG